MPHDSPPALAAATLGAIAAEVMSITFESIFRADTDADRDKHRDNGAEATALNRGLAISLAGAPSYQLVVAWATTDETALLEHFRGGDSSGLEQTSIKDALGEIINIVAGQIKSQLALDHALSLPKLMTDSQLHDWRHENGRDGVWLQAGVSQARVRMTFRTAP